MTSESVAIIGVGRSRLGRRLDEPALGLCVEATRAALSDANIDASAIDGLSGTWPTEAAVPVNATNWARLLGTTLTWVNGTHPTGPVGLANAVAAIRADLCHTVLLVDGQSRLSEQPEQGGEFAAPWGTIPPVLYALVAQQHMRRFGTTTEQLAGVAATIRNHGSDTPGALFEGRGPYKNDDIVASRMVATPFHLLDLAMVSEGASAVVVSSRIPDPDRAVYIRGAATEFTGDAYLDAPIFDEVAGIGTRAADLAFGQAQLSRRDIDVFELFDSNSFEVIRQFEVLGYCEPGAGGPFVAEGIGIDSRHPTCTDGGMLSYANIGSGQRNLKLAAAVRQLRGEAGATQVEGARTAVVTAGGSAARYLSVAVLATEQA